MKENEDEHVVSIYDIIKAVLEDYTGLPVEQNMHVQMSMMWRLSELMEEGSVELFDETIIEYDGHQDLNRSELVEISYFIAAKYSGYLTFTSKAVTDKDKFKNIEKKTIKINKKRNGKNN